MIIAVDVYHEETLATVGPFFVNSWEEAAPLAFDELKAQWSDDVMGGYDNWDDFAADCGSTDFLEITPARALEMEGKISYSLTEADARNAIETGRTVAMSDARMCRLDLLAGYQRLHDGLSDLIEGGRLEECDIPDDYQWLCDSLEKLSGIECAGSTARRVVECAAETLAKAEPLPTALHMLHMIADGADNAPTLAVYAIRALQRIVAASVDLHAALGEAMETHIYNFDNGDTIPADCQFQKALDALTSAFQGSPHSYVTPALPTPWIMAYGADRVTLVSEPTGGEVLPVINHPTDAQLRTVQFIMETANAARALPVKKEA